MRRHAVLFGSFVALLTSQAAMLDAQPVTPTPLGRWGPPSGVSGPAAAIWGGLGLIGTVLSGGWPTTPLPAGMIVPPRRPEEDLFTALDLNGFQDKVRRAMASIEQKGEPTAFFEREVARRADCFGNVCHVFSTYESRHAPLDEKPFARGVNSIQLLNDGKRWWIASVTWETERPDNPIPPDYPATIPPEYLRKN